MKNRFEYFLNAVHYCLWLADKKSGDFIGKIVNTLLSPIPKYLFTKEYKKKCDERLQKQQKEIDKFFYDKKSGLSIGLADNNFVSVYSFYPCFLSWVLIGIADRWFGNLHNVYVLLLIALPIGLCYIPAYRAVFTKDKYLKYFKQFEKEDDRWHRKWKWITLLFCLGAVFAMVTGFLCMAFITSM